MKEYNGRAVHQVELRCLRELPLDDRYSYVTQLPVYVLECLGNDMVVTDFSSISNSVLAGNSIKANSLPRRYQLNTKPLDLDYLFYIVSKSLSRDQLLNLRPNEKFTRLYELGIVIMVEIQVNIALDGVYAELISWKRFSGDDKFRNFMSIFKSNVNNQIYTLNNKYDNVDKAISQDIKPEIVGSQLLFRHVAEDSQASLFPPTQMEEEEEQPSLEFESQVFAHSIPGANDGESDQDQNEKSDSSNGGAELSNNQPMPHPILRQAEHSVEVHDSQGFNDDVIIKKLSIKNLLKLSITEEVLNKNQIYQISGVLLGYIPNKPFIIKPFNRTVKFANFKLIFQSLSNQIDLQFNSETEICKFLKLNEVEEIFNDFSLIDSKFESLFSSKKTIDIQVKLSTKKLNNRIYSYWTCLNDLDDLVDRI